MTEKFRLSADGTTAIDTEVSYYPMNTCPNGVKVQLHTNGGVALYGNIRSMKEAAFYKGWRPVPAGLKDV